MSSVPGADDGIARFHNALRPRFGTEAAVYGTILVSGLIAVSSTQYETSIVVLIKVGVTVLIFWGAHVFAGTIARLGLRGPDEKVAGLRSALRSSATHSLGMLTSAAIPALILLAGTTRIIPDEIANDVALWSGVVVLAVLGYVGFSLRGAPQWIRILGALATASFGLAFVLLKALVH